MKKIILITNKRYFCFLLCISVFLLISLIKLYPGILMVDTFNELYSQVKLPSENKQSKLAIVIDDFGSGRDGVAEMMSIKRHLTFAVMPFLRFSELDSKRAKEKGYEVIIHAPMEDKTGRMSWLGGRPILCKMKSSEIKGILTDSFESIPFAVGLNNHMGSEASGDKEVITSILEFVREKNKIFVDSRTAKKPIAKKLAKEMGARCYDRNVFLDGKKDKNYIKNQLRKSKDMAIKKGTAVAIGHVGPHGGKVTAQAILESLPDFDDANVKLVFITELD